MSERRIWILQGAHAGDNAQARAVAALVPGTAELKVLTFNPLYHLPNVLQDGRLWSLDRLASDDLAPPWPDLVIAAGRRTVPVARWIKRQSEQTKLVQIGRPRAPLHWFDLVITSAQYGLPAARNVLHTVLPPVTLDVPDAQTLDHWRGMFANLPQPWTGLLVGGVTRFHRFDAEAARRLAFDASSFVRREGGSLLVSTSPRTDPAAVSVLEAAITVPSHFHRWRKAGANPHQAILALASRFIVTSDSASMMAEACLTSKPLYLFEVPVRGWRLRFRMGEAAARTGLKTPPREIEAVTRELVAGGHATPLGDAGGTHRPLPDMRPQIRDRIAALMMGP